MNKQKIFKTILNIGAVVLAAYLILVSVIPSFKAGAISPNLAGEPTQLVGSRTGTSTTPAFFGAPAASTTYPIFIGGDKTNLTLFIESMASSSAPTGYAAFSLLGSNDSQCDTATTTTTMAGVVVRGDIDWYDIASNVKEATGLTSLPTATTTFNFVTNGTQKGRTLVLKDLNTRCFALEVSASSTDLHVELMTK